MMRRSTALMFALLLLLFPTASNAQNNLGHTEEGIASFYGSKFHGKKTSSGELFNMWAMTAAHKTIPHNARVRVTNLDNSKSVLVRINDHGPHVKGRIIDLSRAAAAKIGMIGKGTARVRLEVVALDDRPDREKHKGNTEFYSVEIARARLSGYAVQLASFQHMGNLIHILNRLKNAGVDNAYVQMATVKGSPVHRIIVGDYETQAAAAWKLKTLREKGFTGFVFQIR